MKFKSDLKNSQKKNNIAINTGEVTWLKKRHIAPQNIVIKLFERSINLHRKTHYQSYRNFYQIITPNFTVCNVKKPPCFLRKFSPCGRFLVAFSADQTSVEIYEYLGAAAANTLLICCPIPPGETVLHSNEPMVGHVLNQIFDRFFRLRGSVHVATNQEQLNRECSLFTSDGKHVIVASASSRDTGANGRLADAYRNNESVTPNPRSPLDDYTLHVIDLESAMLCDSVSFKHDKIFLSHNQGLSLYGSTLVVLSVQHQTLYRYHVTGDGKLLPVQTIGRICYVDDDVLLHACVAHNCPHLQQKQQQQQQQEPMEEEEEEDNMSSVRRDHHSQYGGPGPDASSVASISSSASSHRWSSSQASTGWGARDAQPGEPPSSRADEQQQQQQQQPQPSAMFPNSLFSRGSAWPSGRQQRDQPQPAAGRSGSGRPGVTLRPSSAAAASHTSRQQSQHDHSEGNNIIYSLKHRLLVFLYRLAQEQSALQGSQEPVRQFCASFDTFLHLRMLKMQLLDNNHLLIKYASEDVVTLRSSEPGCQPSYFVVYKMDSAQVIAVYENSSRELMTLYEQFTDFFRNARLPCEPRYLCSPANNIYARQLHERHKATLISSRGGGVTEACKRLLAQLPVACQAFSPSPYLDLSLFTYQDKWVSVMERPKTAADHPIRFYGRDSGLLKFSLEAGGRYLPPPPQPQSLMPLRRLVAFTFHPSDPFTISVQKHMDDYVVSFHVRHFPT